MPSRTRDVSDVWGAPSFTQDELIVCGATREPPFPHHKKAVAHFIYSFRSYVMRTYFVRPLCSVLGMQSQQDMVSILKDSGICWGPALGLLLGAQPVPQLLNAPTFPEASCLALGLPKTPCPWCTFQEEAWHHRGCSLLTIPCVRPSAPWIAQPASHKAKHNFHPHFTDDKTKAQTDEVTCPSSQHKQVVELGLTPETDSKSTLLLSELP